MATVAAQAPGAPPRRHLPSSARRSCHSRVPKRRSFTECLCCTRGQNGFDSPHFSFVCASALILHCLTRPMQLLTVNRDGFAPPSSAPNVNDWAGTLPEFRAKLLANVRAGSVDAALAEFSTSDAVTSAAFTCTLMRALQNFFQFECPPLSYLDCKLLLHFICQSGTTAGLCVAFQK